MKDMKEVENAINTLGKMEGIKLEMCGSWLWISGDTKPHKEELKAAGAHWAPKKKMWFVKPNGGQRFYHHKEQDIDTIRFKYGSETV